MELWKGTPSPPSRKYAEIAAALRDCGMNIQDDDYERIDNLIEENTDTGEETK